MQGTGSNVTSNVSLKTQLLVWIRGIPLITRTMLFVCVGLFVVEFVSIGYMPFVRAFCVSASNVIGDVECL